MQPNQMSQGGNTPMPLAHNPGQPNAPGVGVQEEEDSALTGNMQRHLEMLIGDLEKSHRIPKAKSLEVLSKVVETLKGGGMKKQAVVGTVKNHF